jgi:hypothetical protein
VQAAAEALNPLRHQPRLRTNEDYARAALDAATRDVSSLAWVLIEHTRLSDDGQCSCGHKGRLGESFAVHQAEWIRDYLLGGAS